MHNYLQTGWGDSRDDVNLKQVKEVILAIQKMDDEHGAFWIGFFVGEQEIVLEVDKSLAMIGVFGESPIDKITKQASDWNEVEKCYGMLLMGEISKLKESLE